MTPWTVACQALLFMEWAAISFSRRPSHVQRYMGGRGEEKRGGGSGKEGGKIKKSVDKPKFIKKPETN